MWFSIISAHAAQGKPSEAIRLYHMLRGSSLEPNGHIYVAALQVCARAEDVESGRQLHADVLESGNQHNSFVCNCLVDMDAKCGELEEARRVFESMATRDAVTWNAMIVDMQSVASWNMHITWNSMINGMLSVGSVPRRSHFMQVWSRNA